MGTKEKKMSKADKDRKKKPHDWRPFITVTGSQIGPFSAKKYCLAAIKKQDFRTLKGPPGAILCGLEGNDFLIGFLKSEFETLEAELRAPENSGASLFAHRLYFKLNALLLIQTA